MKKIIYLLKKIFSKHTIDYQLKINQIAIINELVKTYPLSKISELNFKVFSQFNEDLIIQYLINNLNIKNKIFVELGVENYEEANTRLILEKDNWTGLVVDSSKKNINHIIKQNYFWRHNLLAIEKFITKENINEILTDNKINGNIGLLSIDLDGNDLWVWDEIKNIEPDIVILEYNAKFGINRSVSIKYDKNFIRKQIGIDKIIYGASLKALIKISEKKGYSFVTTNQNGHNAFFVKNHLLNDKIFKISLDEGFKKSFFREYLSEDELQFIDDKNLSDHLYKNNQIVEI
tara:strand:- start:9169 stop:10038 length:870 start_codon:yes stop_codon:yes gene_type:complete